MQLVLDEGDISALKPATRADIIATLFRKGKHTPTGSDGSVDWTDVVDLSPLQVEEFMKKVSPEYSAGLKIIAEHGPVIKADMLNQTGITNYGHFQGRMTLRTRTVTGDKDAFLFGWDDWGSTENDGIGHYGVTDETFRSLRKYFKI